MKSEKINDCVCGIYSHTSLTTFKMRTLPLLLLIAAAINCKRVVSSLYGDYIHPITTNEGFLVLIPKIELHAHLHGSIRPSTLQELVHQNLGSIIRSNFFMMATTLATTLRLSSQFVDMTLINPLTRQAQGIS